MQTRCGRSPTRRASARAIGGYEQKAMSNDVGGGTCDATLRFRSMPIDMSARAPPTTVSHAADGSPVRSPPIRIVCCGRAAKRRNVREWCANTRQLRFLTVIKWVPQGDRRVRAQTQPHADRRPAAAHRFVAARVTFASPER
ncbi:hypothetical protein DB771_14810 [Burkholderia sp. AU29985]|nr:hypothetical protein XM57_02120 [Burkholderia cepacia]AYZ95715.1 hypothetical protein EGY28_11035 [Burkholderia dolosa]ETP61640.1 hypothetical protein BDSB_28260 [Burkholderia dolosa PC543]PRE51948.1 hypothetical protein C6P87_09535 [Burkholderia sp. AU12872]PUA76103.1 hypothetical protein DB771_14810 [Burkholderia sp. AU29985]